ncbi:MAG: hypothetical protein AAF720_13920 [Pseudomonadota bacterium]
MKNSKQRSITILAGSVACLTAIGITTALAGPGSRGFDELDTDGDGRVAVSDFSDRAAERAKKADVDGDGFVTREELEAMKQKRRDEMKKRRFPDDNGDGVVSRSEFEGAARKRFDELDTNGDGVLSEDEIPSPKRRGRR